MMDSQLSEDKNGSYCQLVIKQVCLAIYYAQRLINRLAKLFTGTQKQIFNNKKVDLAFRWVIILAIMIPFFCIASFLIDFSTSNQQSTQVSKPVSEYMSKSFKTQEEIIQLCKRSSYIFQQKIKQSKPFFYQSSQSSCMDNSTQNQKIEQFKEEQQGFQQVQGAYQYKNFGLKLNQLNYQSSCRRVHVYPFLKPEATSGKKKSSFSQFALFAFLNKFIPYEYQFDDLKQVIEDRGIWQSSGKMLTVVHIIQHIPNQFAFDKKYEILPIFTPSLIEIQVPYDVPEDQQITFTAMKLDNQQFKRTLSALIREELGSLKINVTEQQYRARMPVKRMFVCRDFVCSRYYSVIRMQSRYNLRLHSFKIYSSNILNSTDVLDKFKLNKDPFKKQIQQSQEGQEDWDKYFSDQEGYKDKIEIKSNITSQF